MGDHAGDDDEGVNQLDEDKGVENGEPVEEGAEFPVEDVGGSGGDVQDDSGHQAPRRRR